MEKKEKNIILFSLIVGVFLFIIGLVMSIKTNSQAMLMDSLYDGVDIIIVILTLFLIRLYHRPISEKKPFGFSQLESFFLLIKTFMIIILNISIIINSIILIINGGKEIDVVTISFFQFILFAGNLITWIIIKQSNKKINSPTVRAEELAWKFDMIYSLGLSFSFFIIQFLKNSTWSNLILYFDQIIVIISSVIMLPDLLRVLKENITTVLLFAPNEEKIDEIKNIVNKNLLNTDLEIVHYDIIKTGRKLWISIYFKTTNNMIDIELLREITIICSKQLNEKIGKAYFELVPDVENYYN